MEYDDDDDGGMQQKRYDRGNKKLFILENALFSSSRLSLSLSWVNIKLELLHVCVCVHFC